MFGKLVENLHILFLIVFRRNNETKDVMRSGVGSLCDLV